MARSFRGEPSRGDPAPGELQEYKARSLLEEHRTLAIVFAVLGLALAVYFVKSVIMAPPRPTPPAQSVYVEVLPTETAPKEAAPNRTPPK